MNQKPNNEHARKESNLRDRLEVMEQEIKEIRAQSEAVRLREEHLQQRYAKLQARYTYLATRLDALEKELKRLKKAPQTEDVIGVVTDVFRTPPVEKKKPDTVKRIADTSSVTIADTDHLLTAPEAAEMMDVSVRTVMTYLKSGELEGTKQKNKWFLRPDDVKQFLESHHIRRRVINKKEE